MQKSPYDVSNLRNFILIKKFNNKNESMNKMFEENIQSNSNYFLD